MRQINILVIHCSATKENQPFTLHDAVVDELGSRENVVTAVFESLSKFDDLPDLEKFTKRVMINNTEIEVTGFVHDGVIKIGTMYVPMGK